MLNYKSFRDPHLNIFWQYEGKPHLENNITKAFINSIDSLSDDLKRKVITKLFSIDLKEGNLKVDCYLQKKPAEDRIKSFPIDNRIMFGFSPTGKCWGFSGQDTKNKKELYKAIYNELSITIKDERECKEATENEVKDYLQNKKDGSIPDGWILIYIDENPQYIIALENKLHNLNPDQINNHIEKSLLITENKSNVIYKKYSEIVDLFLTLDTFTTNQFVEYLTILGYIGLDNFIVACQSDESIREKLTIPFGEKILSQVHNGAIDKRRYNTWRCKVNYKWLGEVNLIIKSDSISLSLAFGPKQSSARSMMSEINGLELSKDHIDFLCETLHLQYKRGRNIKKSYTSYDHKIVSSIDQYIAYWKNNINLIKTCTPQEAIDLYRKLYDDKVIDEQTFLSLKEHLTGKKNPVLVIPEILLEYKWTYDEIVSLGQEGFIKSIKDKLEEALIAVNLKERI